MTTGEILRALKAEGFAATAGKIEYAIHVGRVARPELDGAGNRSFQPMHLEQLRAALRMNAGRRAGRKAQPQA